MSAQPARDPYGRPYLAPEPVEPVAVARPPILGMVARFVLTAAGAAGMIGGAFLDWINGFSGVDLSVRAFYQTNFVKGPQFFSTVGFAFICLGLIAIIGLAPRTGGLTRLAGALGIVGFTLFAIQVGRSDLAMPGAIDTGAWLGLAGGVVALVGGFFGSRTVVVE